LAQAAQTQNTEDAIWTTVNNAPSFTFGTTLAFFSHLMLCGQSLQLFDQEKVGGGLA
jgi:hypothetical protein